MLYIIWTDISFLLQWNAWMMIEQLCPGHTPGASWHVSLSLKACSLTAQFCPTGQRARKHLHMELSLVFFSTFELINITPHSLMQRNGVPMLYDHTARGSNDTSALWAMCWAVFLWYPASLLATNTRRFLKTLAVVRGLLPIRVLAQAMAAGSLRWALGCGATGGARQERSVWLKLRPEAGADFGMLASGGSDLEEALGSAWGWFLWAPAQPPGRTGCCRSGIKISVI